MDPRELDACVTGCAGAHQQLLDVLDRQLAAGALDATAASRLPDWTVGHVLAHLVGNAQACTRVIIAAAGGAVSAMYPDGVEGRRADIEAGATLSPERLVMEVRRSIWALESAWAACSAEGWRGRARAFSGEFAVAEVPLRRWREVEVHHTDLGLGHEPEQWNPDYVKRDLVIFEAMWLSQNPEFGDQLPAVARDLAPGVRLAWLLGRVRPPDLPGGLSL